jgi:hypothetical protein
MAMDGIALGAVIHELQPLIGGKIDKVQQPEKDLLLFVVRANNGNQRLLFSIHAENGRIQLTNRSFDNPMNAPAFCMLLRRRLVEVVSARFVSLARIASARSSILARNELFDEVALRLIVELTGKHANLILLDQNTGAIVDSLRRVSATNDGARILLPGFPYDPFPSQNKLDPFAVGVETLEQIISGRILHECSPPWLDASQNKQPWLSPFRGLYPSVLATLFGAMKRGDNFACLAFRSEGEPVAALPFLPVGLYARIEPMNSMSEALDRYYADRDQIVPHSPARRRLRHTVSSALSRAQNKYAAFLKPFSKANAHDAARSTVS